MYLKKIMQQHTFDLQSSRLYKDLEFPDGGNRLIYYRIEFTLKRVQLCGFFPSWLWGVIEMEATMRSGYHLC